MQLMRDAAVTATVFATGLVVAACATAPPPRNTSGTMSPRAEGVTSKAALSSPSGAELASQPDLQRSFGAGNPDGHAFVPLAARAINTSHASQIIGNGTPSTCTSAAVVKAVAQGGVITFNCGPKPVTITMTATAKVVNTSQQVVLDGGGLVTLSGGGKHEILYMDTCDKKQIWTTDHCVNQQWPELVVQNMTFEDGYSPIQQTPGTPYGGGGGGAIYAEGGQLKVVDSQFLDNRCYKVGPDLGGAAIRAISQWSQSPIYITSDTFHGGVCSNGGALSSIGSNWDVINSVLTGNRAIGWGANPARPSTPGGGSGGAIYNDGDSYNLFIAGTIMSNNIAREGGGAIFFVADNNIGVLTIKDSTLHDNPSEGFSTGGYPGIFYHSTGHPIVIDSTIN